MNIIKEEICLHLFKIILLQYIKIFHATLCKFSDLLACVLLTTSQPFLGLMLFPNISATDILRGVCKTRTGCLRMADADGKMRMEKCG